MTPVEKVYIMATEKTRQLKGNLPVLTDPPPQWLTDYTRENHRKFNELLQELERNERNAPTPPQA